MLYPEWWESLKDLSIEDKWKILEAIFEYDATGSTGLGWYLLVVFNLLKNRFDADKSLYEETCEKRKQISNGYWSNQMIPNGNQLVSNGNQMVSNGNQMVPNSKSNTKSKDNLISSDTVACGGLPLSARQELWQWLAPTLLEIWPAADIPKQVDKCFAFYYEKGTPINDAAKMLTKWFINGRWYAGDYKAGLSPPETPEEWVAEHNKLQGIKFTQKYWAEKAREVRERRDNFRILWFYVDNSKPYDWNINSDIPAELSTQW